MKKYNYDLFKGDTQLLKAYRSLSKDLYKLADCDLQSSTAEDFFRRYDHFIDLIGYDNFCLLARYSKLLYARVRRIRNRIKDIFASGEPCFFVTLTLRDSCLSYRMDTLRRGVKSCFAYSLNFVANEDYSPVTGRLHFHAVVAGDPSFFSWSYGFLKVESITVRDPAVLAKYLDKLTSHAVKECSGRPIFSRTKKT